MNTLDISYRIYRHTTLLHAKQRKQYLTSYEFRDLAKAIMHVEDLEQGTLTWHTIEVNFKGD